MPVFPKAEKLCGQTRIDHLYHTGKRLVVWPLRITYLPIDEKPTEVLIWAPKSLFKHAVDRNRLRRRMREAYRLNKQVIEIADKHYLIGINYIDRQTQDYRVIEKAMRKVLTRLAQTGEGQP